MYSSVSQGKWETCKSGIISTKLSFIVHVDMKGLQPGQSSFLEGYLTNQYRLFHDQCSCSAPKPVKPSGWGLLERNHPATLRCDLAHSCITTRTLFSHLNGRTLNLEQVRIHLKVQASKPVRFLI